MKTLKIYLHTLETRGHPKVVMGTSIITSATSSNVIFYVLRTFNTQLLTSWRPNFGSRNDQKDRKTLKAYSFYEEDCDKKPAPPLMTPIPLKYPTVPHCKCLDVGDHICAVVYTTSYVQQILVGAVYYTARTYIGHDDRSSAQLWRSLSYIRGGITEIGYFASWEDLKCKTCGRSARPRKCLNLT